MKYDIFRLNCDNTKDILETLEFDNYEEVEKYVRELNESRTYTVYFQPNPEWMRGGVIYDDGFICKSNSDIDHWFAAKISKLNVKMENASPRRKARLEAKIRKWKERSHSIHWRQVVLVWDKICDFFEYDLYWRFANKFNDWRAERKRVRYFKKNHHDIREYWSLDCHLLEDIRWNLRILIDKGHGFSNKFVEEVLKEEYGDDPNFDVNAYLEQNPNIGEDIDKKAIERQKQTYERIIHLIDLYEFYDNTQLGENPNETKTPDMVKFVRPGTYDVVDYTKMHNKAQELWGEIWDLIKEYGQGMWD